MEMNNNTWRRVAVLFFCGLVLTVASCRKGANPPAGGGECLLHVDTTRTNGSLSCGRTLSHEDQAELLYIALANNGVPCHEGDTLRLHKLEIQWVRDGERGWDIEGGTCTLSVNGKTPEEAALEGDHLVRAEEILTRDAYCALGESCAGCDCGQDLCCETGNGPCCDDRGCNQRHSTGGVIIAVVASVPLN